MRTRIPTLLALASLLGGCAAAKSTIHLAEAEAAIRRAEDFDARDLAPYEYTLARRYLEKAREEQGYADHKVSVQLSRKSEEWSDQAIIFIERSRLGVDADDLSAVPERPDPPEAPAGAGPDGSPEAGPTGAPQAPAGADPLLEPSNPVEPLPPAEPEPEPEPEPDPGDEFEVEEDFQWENE